MLIIPMEARTKQTPISFPMPNGSLNMATPSITAVTVSNVAITGTWMPQAPLRAQSYKKYARTVGNKPKAAATQ